MAKSHSEGPRGPSGELRRTRAFYGGPDSGPVFRRFPQGL